MCPCPMPLPRPWVQWGFLGPHAQCLPPTPLTPGPEPTHGAPLAARPLPAMGTARTSSSRRRAAQLGSLPVPPVVSVSRSPGPFGSTAQLSGPQAPVSWQDCPSLLDRPGLGSPLKPGTWSLQVGPWLWGVQRPFCKPPSHWTVQAPWLGSSAPGAMPCGRRAGGKALTWQSLLSLPRSPLPASSFPS